MREIEWSKVKLKNNKDLHIASFYMPHRNMKDLDNLRLSLDKLTGTFWSSVDNMPCLSWFQE
jgi:hypothetical protein